MRPDELAKLDTVIAQLNQTENIRDKQESIQPGQPADKNKPIPIPTLSSLIPQKSGTTQEKK